MILAAVLATALVVYSSVTNLRPTGNATYVIRNVVTGVVLVLIARAAGLSWEELGLDRQDLSAGLRWGWLTVLIAAVALAGAAALADRFPVVGRLLSDRRADLEPDELAVHAFVRIPIGTAVFEEIAFRAVLLGAFLAVTSTPWAVAWSSVAFGLWHVVPALRRLDINDVEDPAARRGSVIGAVVFTGLAGVLFCLLRLGSGSVMAPILAHAAVNSLGLLVAAFHQRTAG